MFRWLKTRLVGWVERRQQKKIEELLREGLRLKEELLRLNGGGPIRLTPEECQLLVEKRKGIDPEILKRVDLRLDDPQ